MKQPLKTTQLISTLKQIENKLVEQDVDHSIMPVGERSIGIDRPLYRTSFHSQNIVAKASARALSLRPQKSCVRKSMRPTILFGQGGGHTQHDL